MTWKLAFALAVVVACFPPHAAAGQADGSTDFPILRKDQIIKLVAHPATAPVPALKYRLLPELRDMHDGNAAVRYYRAFSPEWLNFYNKDLRKALTEWLDNPRKKPAELLDIRGGPLQEIDEGARRTYCDWDMLRGLRRDGLAMLLPDMQSFRIYHQLSAARTRFRILDGDYKKAAHCLQSGFGFSRHIADGPTLIQSLVGIDMARRSLIEVEAWIRQKDSPNLYWSLTHLPRPFIDLRRPLQGEKVMIDQMFPGWRRMLNDKNARPLSMPEIEGRVDEILKLATMLGGMRGGRQVMNRFALAVLAAKEYPAAKEFLLQQGRPPDLVEKMPVTQAVLLYEVHLYDRRYDDMIKWYGLPAVQARRGIHEYERQLRHDATAGADGFLARMLTPAANRAFDAAYGLDRRIAGLRCIEAIRLYAAAHEELPAKLSDIQEVPIPNDPFTGEPFQYHVKGDTAYLYTAPPKEHGRLAASARSHAWRYELTLKK